MESPFFHSAANLLCSEGLPIAGGFLLRTSKYHPQPVVNGVTVLHWTVCIQSAVCACCLPRLSAFSRIYKRRLLIVFFILKHNQEPGGRVAGSVTVALSISGGDDGVPFYFLHSGDCVFCLCGVLLPHSSVCGLSF